MLTRTDLHSLEEYSKIRNEFKRAALNHRKQRQVELGSNMTLHFEDRVTIKYQIQEMLLIEKTFTAEGIQDELDSYNPLIPTGSNLKATLTIEYSDAQLRHQKLQELNGIENSIFMQVEGHTPVFAIADEDIERSTDTKTSAVHFLRFEFTPSMIEDLKSLDKQLIIGTTHSSYNSVVKVNTLTKEMLVKDFDENNILA